MYTAPRRIRYGNAFSKSAYTEIGVLAGCPVAMGLLLLSVLEPMDKFWKTIPRELISAMVYVDDFALSFAFQKASTTLIKCRVTVVLLALKQQLQNHGLFLADDKSKLTASKAEVGQAIKEHMERSHHLKIAYQANMTMLGVDYAAGKPVTYGRANQRFREAMIKGNKITVIAKGGWRLLNVMKAHVVSTVTYSEKVNGLRDATLEATRTMVRSATSTRAGGGSATVDMMLQSDKYVDPAYVANTLPLIEWATRVNFAAHRGDDTVMKKHRNAWRIMEARPIKKYNEATKPLNL